MRTRSIFAFALLGAATATASAGTSDLRITEIYEGVNGEDLTADWFEITNFGSSAFTFGVDGNLYYDDESADPTVDDQITGITAIAPGESVIVLATESAADIDAFSLTWGANVAGVQIGYLISDNPAGLSQGGDGVFLFDGNTAGANLVSSASYVGESNPGYVQGATWTYNLGADAFTGDLQSALGVNGAFASAFNAGDFQEIPLIGSPGVIPTPGAVTLIGLGGLAAARRRRA